MENKQAPSIVEGVVIPDEAIYYIVSNFLQKRSVPGMPVVTGVSTQTVEDILQLLVDWSTKNGYVDGATITIGGKKK